MNLCYQGQELEIFAQALHWKAYYKHLLKPFLGKKVLEVGAGIGATTAVLCDDRQEEWWCLEPDGRLLAQIEEKIHAGSLPACCRPWYGTVDDLPADFQADSVLYIDVLEHVEDDQSELQKAAGRMRSAGHLIVLAPAMPSLYSPFDEAIGHYRRYTRQSLCRIAPPSLKPIRVRYLDSAGLLLSLANRWWLRQPLPTRQQIQFWDGFIIPFSRFLDRLVNYSFGRSILAIWKKA